MEIDVLAGIDWPGLTGFAVESRCAQYLASAHAREIVLRRPRVGGFFFSSKPAAVHATRPDPHILVPAFAGAQPFRPAP